jgi:lipopolysaccharide export system protein LptA
MIRRRRLPGWLGAGLVALGLALSAAGGALAQSLSLGGEEGSGPVEIEAEESLEWRSEEQEYVARGNAVIRRDDLEVRADLLRAHYRELEDGGTEIYRASAEGNVEIETEGGRAWADVAVYDLDQAVMVLTGDNLRLENQDGVVTAEDSLEYWVDRQLAVARGDAAVTRGDDRVSGDVLTGQFAEDEQGEMKLSVVSAVGNVLVITGEDRASGDEAVYDLDTNMATLGGNVRLNRGDNQLNGDFAEVDLDTGVSRLLAGPDGGRVRGLLVPGDESRADLP